MYTLVAFKDGKAVGMGRIVGDGAIICYVQDLIIRPEVQGEGIGGLILETLKKFVIQEGYEGTTMMFDLMCAKGREEFYKSMDLLPDQPRTQVRDDSVYSDWGRGLERV